MLTHILTCVPTPQGAQERQSAKSNRLHQGEHSGQADEGVSLAAQRAKIEAWCSSNDAELVAVFEDAGISGASMNGREGCTRR